MTLTQYHANQHCAPASMLFAELQGLLDERGRHLESGSTTAAVKWDDSIWTFRAKALQQAPNGSHG